MGSSKFSEACNNKIHDDQSQAGAKRKKEEKVRGRGGAMSNQRVQDLSWATRMSQHSPMAGTQQYPRAIEQYTPRLLAITGLDRDDARHTTAAELAKQALTARGVECMSEQPRPASFQQV